MPMQAPEPRAPLPTGLKFGPLAMAVVWLLVLGVLYLGFKQYLAPKPVVVTAAGDLVIPRAPDGHFYVEGTVGGQPVRFLVDTGASMVAVSPRLAAAAGLQGGEAIVFKTANGDMPGRMYKDVPVTVGPIRVSAVRVGAGLVGGADNEALLGQAFLGRFDITLSDKQMVLKAKPR